MSINELQQELCEKLANIIIESDDNKKNTMHIRMIDIIDELKGHINDIIEYNGMAGTALDYVIFFSSQGYGRIGATRIHSPVLESLESTIKAMEGRTSEELGRNLNSHATEEAIAFGVAAVIGAVGVAAAVAAEVAINRARINTARAGAVLLMAGFASELLKDSGTNLENPTIEQPNRQSRPQI